MPMRTSRRFAQTSADARWNGRSTALWRTAPSSVRLTTMSSTGVPCSGIGACS